MENSDISHSSDTSSVGSPILEILKSRPHRFQTPTKRIHDGQDVSSFLTSSAYQSIMTFLFQLNRSMFPYYNIQESKAIQSWDLDSSIPLAPATQRLRDLVKALDAIINEAPPDTGPRRFGNVSFRKWYDLVESRLTALLKEAVDPDVLGWPSFPDSEHSAETELRAYLMGSFGSSQRLDYGTGHELSFLAFLGCLWKLGAFPNGEPGVQERGIVIGVIEPYLRLVRRLILTYNLEPAGSHGVWGLDDHAFIPYILGSAQLSPAISADQPNPTEGSLPNAPQPSDVTNSKAVERERKHNMYFSAIGFIYDVKKGPFWEHSPMLYDISGIRTGWAKVNKGMIKMYNAEVLSKFPVVQHFPFGSLFSWDQDPSATSVLPSIHTSSQPSNLGFTTNQESSASLRLPQEVAKAPSVDDGRIGQRKAPSLMPSTVAPWARESSSGAANLSGFPEPTRPPWAKSATPASALRPDIPTRAPWAKPQSSDKGGK